MSARKQRVLVAMSGGVDSSVAAALLKREGHEVIGCFMRLGSPGEPLEELQLVDGQGVSCDPARARVGHQGCCSINDAADARLVASKLDVPLYVCNFKRDFGRIIEYFVDEYNAGRTPNPCVRCNDWLKFGKLHDYAAQIGADAVASGHYARIGPGPRLLRGLDRGKDQSYVLFGVPRDRLPRMRLPIGEFRKSRVREMAAELDLPVFDKPDSQEICFVPDQDYAGLVKRRTPERVEPGAIVDHEGRVLGEHPGHQHYTVGQRRGLGVALGHPLYVIEKNALTNTVRVGEKRDLLASGCRAEEANWLLGPPDGAWIRCDAQIRSNADAVPARVRAAGETGLVVQFDEPQFAVAPGQAVVCYQGDVVLCGGWITHADARISGR